MCLACEEQEYFFRIWCLDFLARGEMPPGVTAERYGKQHGAVEYLTEHFHEAPVWIVACLVDGPNPNRGTGASIYPAVQNMLLTIRALGLGSTLTTPTVQTTPYDTVKDLAPIAAFSLAPFVLCVSAESRLKTLNDLIALHESGALATPSSHVRDLEPTIERAILRCLEREPAKRPPSALAVSAALPGGDQLAAALAAGETPSPEMVAAATEPKKSGILGGLFRGR